MKRIETTEELFTFLPKLVQLHEQLEHRWQAEHTQQKFAAKLLELFKKKNYYFGELDEKGNIKYFFAVVDESKGKAYYWLLYIHKDLRTVSKELVHNSLNFLRSKGFTSVEFATTRLTRSYKRWVEGFGARAKTMIYEIDLTQ